MILTRYVNAGGHPAEIKIWYQTFLSPLVQNYQMRTEGNCLYEIDGRFREIVTGLFNSRNIDYSDSTQANQKPIARGRQIELHDLSPQRMLDQQ